MAERASIAFDPAAYGSASRGLSRTPAAQESRRRDAQAIDLPDAPRNRVELTRATVEAQRALREAAVAAATAAVRARSMAAALDEALAALVDAESAAAGTPRAAITTSLAKIGISPRERDVLALVAEGRSNKAIAEALYVSPNTVKTHVASLLHKHGVGSRAQLAALVAGQAVR